MFSALKNLKLPRFSKEKTKFDFATDENFVAIDIGTEQLKTILFNVTPNGVIVKKVSRIAQQQSAMSKGTITNLDRVIENCNLAMAEITSHLKDNQLPRYMTLGLAGEYIQGVAIIVNYEREDNHNEPVTQEEEEEIIEKVHEKLIESGKDDLALRTGLLKEDIEILHITTTGLEIGGMPVDSLIGHTGKAIKLYFYASFAPKTYVTALSQVAENLEMSILGIVSQPFAVSRAYIGSRDKNFSGIFVDIGGGTTDVAIVKNGNIIDTKIFALGGRAFTKELERVQSIDYRHAEKRKIKYASKQLEGLIQEDVKRVLTPIAQIWMKSLEATFKSMSDIKNFPINIYLSGGGALLPEIKSSMLEYPWSQELAFSKIPKIQIFTPDKLTKVEDVSGQLINAYDITPSGLCVFTFDKLNNPENYNAGYEQN